MAKELTKQEINEIMKIVDRYVVINEGLTSWRETAKKIKKSFKDPEKKDVALIMLGFKMGIEHHSKQTARNLENLLPYAKNVLDKANKFFDEGE
jgi:ABC-type multidrug transport system ATPase subunit